MRFPMLKAPPGAFRGLVFFALLLALPGLGVLLSGL